MKAFYKLCVLCVLTSVVTGCQTLKTDATELQNTNIPEEQFYAIWSICAPIRTVIAYDTFVPKKPYYVTLNRHVKSVFVNIDESFRNYYTSWGENYYVMFDQSGEITRFGTSEKVYNMESPEFREAIKDFNELKAILEEQKEKYYNVDITYNDNGLPLSYSYCQEVSGVPYEFYSSYKYDSHDNLLEQKYGSRNLSDGTSAQWSYSYTYKYDKDGNWIEMRGDNPLYYDGDRRGIKEITIYRIIEYYDE